MTVQGELGAHAASAFAGLKVSAAEGNTVIEGELRDQAELQGLLRRISDLGLDLLQADSFESRPEGRSGHDREPPDAAGHEPLGASGDGYETRSL